MTQEQLDKVNAIRNIKKYVSKFNPDYLFQADSKCRYQHIIDEFNDDIEKVIKQTNEKIDNIFKNL